MSTSLIVESAPPRDAQRRVPTGGWTVMGIYPQYTAYQQGRFCALSSLVDVYDDHQPAHWEWLISFSNMGNARLSNAEIQKCLKDFNALDFMEDNHEPGVARKFWLAVEEKYRVPCPCQNEHVIVEGDYKYSVKKGAGL